MPFCRLKCDYCSFYSVPTRDLPAGDRTAQVDAYCNALLREIKNRTSELDTLVFDTVYFGGGTPSLLTAEQVKEVLRALEDLLPAARDGMEITLECNPEDFGKEKIYAYRDAGINRVVLGIQTMNPDLHDFIGRTGELCRPAMLESFMKIPGITHCIDIITGIPGQSIRQIRDELSIVAGMKPEHISAYMLSIEKGTRLHERYIPDDEFPSFQREIFSEVMDILTDKGYEHYEVSNFALPGFISRHNMKYWTFRPYAGFGPGAHSFTGGRRYSNTLNVEEYLAMKTRVEYDARNENTVTVEYVMTGMRLARGISEKSYLEDTGREFPEELRSKLAKMINNGHIASAVKDRDTRYSFTREGMFIMDVLLAELLDDYIA